MLWLDRIIGVETVHFSARERRVYSALLMRAGILAADTENLDDGGLSVSLRRRDLRRLRAMAAQRGLPIPVSISQTGLPRLAAYLKMRPGLPIGITLAVLIWVISTCFVWRVDVVCLDNAQGTAARDFVDVEEVRDSLAEMGVCAGMFLPGMDARRLENRFLIGREDVSWIAINRCGTVLSVEVRPAHTASRDQEPSLDAQEDEYLYGTNLVADADGRVLSFSVRGGQPVVTAEQFVLRGELLASGIYTSETGDAVGGRAHGEVLAQTVRILTAEIPLHENVAETTGTARTTYTLCLFGKPRVSVSDPRTVMGEIVTFLETFFKIGEKSGIDGESCGIITNETISDTAERTFTLPNGPVLPLSVRQTTAADVMYTVRSLTEEEALLRAKTALDAQEAALGAARIDSREETTVWEDGILCVTRYVYCVDNIAVEQAFRIKAEP